MPVEGNFIILQHISKASLGAVLADDSNIGHRILHRDSDELAEVLVVQHSAGTIRVSHCSLLRWLLTLPDLHALLRWLLTLPDLHALLRWLLTLPDLHALLRWLLTLPDLHALLRWLLTLPDLHDLLPELGVNDTARAHTASDTPDSPDSHCTALTACVCVCVCVSIACHETLWSEDTLHC